MYKHWHATVYIIMIECCVAHHDVQCTDGYIHFMKCTDIAETQGTYIDMSFQVWLQLFLFALLAGL